MALEEKKKCVLCGEKHTAVAGCTHALDAKAQKVTGFDWANTPKLDSMKSSILED